MEAKPQKPTALKQTPEAFIKDVRRKARKIYSSEQKILIVMEALRGEVVCKKRNSPAGAIAAVIRAQHRRG